MKTKIDIRKILYSTIRPVTKKGSFDSGLMGLGVTIVQRPETK
jgi:adenine-specific DNA glycosylase